MNKYVLALALCAITGFAPVVAADPQNPDVPAEESQQQQPDPVVAADCKYVVPHCDSVD
ncbi:hypothetical protein [Rheinheimera sp. 4Y26]|uniref:hypothetical protein n=1 Tax=Rheinheimera sp. 4Y26 TaxID=2977811 RepID=UPI0021B0C7F5|nr:hypothetical protein [Rheinheimera sp. 4Y26]MCT6698897.1 hypothetical protein [Rheinheimera sp. 4Y26]